MTRDAIELECEFSECHDKCSGIDELSCHVAMHIEIMRGQLTAETDGDDSQVDHSRCECPWRECQTILEVASDWSHCLRHLYYHVFHTYLKVIGDDELERRGITITCTRQSNRNSIPDLAEPLICRWRDCGFSDENPWTFYRHVDTHAADVRVTLGEKRQCRWDSCEYATKATVTKLRDHLHIHTQERRYGCSACGSLYSQSTRLEDHQKRHDNREKSFQCSHCSKKCSTERLLRDHLRKHVNLYGCMFCDMTCPSPSALRIHIMYRHSAERPYSCSECDATYKTKYALANHTLSHAYEGAEFICSVDYCGFKCRSTDSMKRHSLEAHKYPGRIYGCHICEDVFKQGVELSAHLKEEHELKYPSGHVRFRFATEADGIRRLVTVRYECFQGSDEEDEGEEYEERACSSADAGQHNGSISEEPTNIEPIQIQSTDV